MEKPNLKASSQGKTKLSEARNSKGMSQETLAGLCQCARQTIHSMFQGNNVRRYIFIAVCEQLNLKWQDIAQPETDETDIVPLEDQNTQPQIPDEFVEWIKEITQYFCGRELVFEVIEQFLAQNLKGYLTLVARPGFGKSAILAKYVKDRHVICYFNMLTNGRNRPEFFLDSIRTQLIRRYNLQGVEQAYLESLLKKASQKLRSGERLIVVVDALDEVEQEQDLVNLLHLPRTLPDGVYFLLTRRPYISEDKQLKTDLGTPNKELDLTKPEYNNSNQEDIKKYIWRALRGELSDMLDEVALQNWVEAQSDLSTQEEFVEALAIKSENNFLYLKYVLLDITTGKCKNLQVKQLPNGLVDYYNRQVRRMRIEGNLIVLYAMVEWITRNHEKISIQLIVEFSEKDRYEVSCFLGKNYQFLRVEKNKDEELYTFFHKSFLDHLKSRDELNSDRQLFNIVNDRISDYNAPMMEKYLDE